MKKLCFIFILSCLHAPLFAGHEYEIRGHLIDQNKNKPFSGGMRFENSNGELVEYVQTDRHGLFIIYINDTGRYNLIYYVGICRHDTLRFHITGSTPYIVNSDFYTFAWDYNCEPDNFRVRTRLIPRAGFMQGWRSMLDLSCALRFKPKAKALFVSHSITAGAEWNYGFNRWLLGTKIGYTYLNECFDYSGITVGVNVVYFVDKSNGAFYLQPQIAFEGIEFIEILSQYNIPLSSDVMDYRVNQLSVGFRIWMR